MAKEKFIKVLPQYIFDEEMHRRGINDENVEVIDDEAFISIINTKECLKHYLEDEGTKHYFSENHSNVINLDFDDLENDFVWHGHLFKAMDEKQAEGLFGFIERNIGKSFTIHCRAGFSRSQAVGAFIKDNYKDVYTDENTDSSTINRDRLNHGVMKLLMRKLYEKRGLFTEQ